MYKKLVSTLVGIALLASPLIVSAQSADTTQASLIASLTALVQTLSQELEQLLAARGITTPPAGCNQGYVLQNDQCVPDQAACPTGYTGTYPNCVAPTACPAGSTGTYPNCSISNICRVYLFPLCPSGGIYISATLDNNGCQIPGHYICSQGSTLSVAPSSGSAPLTVSFSSPWGNPLNASGVPLTGTNTLIDFGDGSLLSIDCAPSAVISSTCSTPVTISHTYMQAGTYTAAVKSQPSTPNPVTTTLGTATVTVTSPNSVSVPTVTLTQSADTSVSGTPFTVNWSSTGATSCTLERITPAGTTTIMATALSGSRSVALGAYGTHHIWFDCNGTGGYAHADLYHTVTR